MTSIVIDLDEEELQQIAAILVENYIETNFVRKENVNVYKYMKKAVTNLSQFAGIMFSLVGANILTKIYEREHAVVTQFTDNENKLNTKIIDEINILCNHIFGCDDGHCWRTCSEKGVSNKAICETKPIFKAKCSSADDCDQCGECTTDCKSRL